MIGCDPIDFLESLNLWLKWCLILMGLTFLLWKEGGNWEGQKEIFVNGDLKT